MEAEALMGVLPHIYRDHDYIGKPMEASGAGSAAGSRVDDELRKSIQGLRARVADANTKLVDLQARAFNASAPPARRTIPPEVAALLRKGGLSAEGGKEELSVEQVDRTLEAAGIKGRSAIEAKLKLMSVGVLPVGTR
jgi:NAD(P)H-dependent FMN reductase